MNYEMFASSSPVFTPVMLMPPSKRYAMLAQNVPENHKCGFFIDLPIKKYGCLTPEAFFKSIQMPYMFANVEHWQESTFTFQFSGLQHSFTALPVYVERKTEFKLFEPYKLTLNDLPLQLQCQIERWMLQNFMSNVTVKRLLISL